MTPCPSPELLQRLLADQLSDAEEQAADAHVEACPHCQQILETLTAFEATAGAVASPAWPDAAPLPGLGSRASRTANRAGREALGETELRRLWQLLCPRTPLNGPGPAPAAPVQADWPIVPGYEILGELGRGGMGIVYRARQLRLNRLVALKLVRADAAVTPAQRPRFLVEGEALARLQHPNVVRIYDVGFCRGQPYFALELVEGGSLAARLGGKPLPAREAARLVDCLAQAVQAAHAQNIVHRDLKPGNVLLTADGVPKLTDFGLAKTLDVDLNLTRTGEVLGTPAYMAPEQALGRAAEVGPLADVHALGVILYEALTGRPPFLAASYQQFLQQLSWHEPVSLRQLQPQVPRDLETVCLRCLQKEPRSRYASAGALAEDLQRFLDHRPILARPAGPVERLARWCRRNPLPASLLAAVVLVFLAGFAGVFWQWRVAETARQAEKGERDRAEELRSAAERQRDAAQWREYRANMAAVSSALNLNNVGEARRLLEASNPDYRGWEWRHFRTQLDGARAVLRHSDMAVYVSFNRDGTRLATASRDGWFRVWDSATGQQLLQRRFPDPVVANPYAFGTLVEFLPDGRLLSMSHLGKARIWNPDAPDTPPDREVPAGEVYRAWPSPNGSYVVWRHGDTGEMWLWDFSQKRAPERLPTGLPAALAFSRDSRLIAIPVENSNFVIWDVARHSVIRRFSGHSVHPTAFAFSPRADRIVSGSLYPESEVRLWTTEGKLLHRQNVHRNSISDLAYSPDGSRLASASLDQTVGLWHAATLEPLALLRGHTGRVIQVQFTPDSNRLVSLSDDLSIRLWEAARGDPVAVLHGHTETINLFALSPNGNMLASAANDGTVRLWDLKQAEARNGLRGHTSYVYDATFSPDGRQIASAAWDGTVRLWDATTLQERAVWKQETAKNPIVQCVVWSRNGRRLAAVAQDHFVHIWDAKARKKLRTLDVPNNHWKSDTRAAFHPDGTLLATGSRDGLVAVWNPETGARIAQWNGQHGLDAEDRFVSDVAFSPDGQTLATTGADNVLRLWRVADVLAGRTAAPRAALTGHTDFIHRVVWSQDGKWLATASQDRSVRLWSADEQKEIARLPHGSVVYGVAFSPDEKRLASGCADNTIRIWDLATRDQVGELRGHHAYVKSVAFSPDGEQLVSASGDSTIRVWDTLSVPERAARGWAPTAK